MPKSPDAFRTISEVADWLGVQAHVLRFWESKFAQVKPTKRAGGRRYYRPSDMLLLGGIKKLLHDDGLTIKGAQKLLREKGVAFVADMSQPLDDLTMAVIESNSTSELEAQEQTGRSAAAGQTGQTQPAPEMAAQASPPSPQAPEPATPAPEAPPEIDRTMTEAPAAALEELPVGVSAEETGETEDTQASFDLSQDLESIDAAIAPPDESEQQSGAIEEEAEEPAEEPEPEVVEAAAPTEPDATQQEASPGEDIAAPEIPPAPEPVAADGPDTADPSPEAAEAEPEAEIALPSFRARARPSNPPPAPADRAPETDPREAGAVPDSPVADDDVPTAPPPAPAPRTPLGPGIPALPMRAELTVKPSLMSALARLKSLTPEQAREIKPHLARLARLRDSMAAPRED